MSPRSQFRVANHFIPGSETVNFSFPSISYTCKEHSPRSHSLEVTKCVLNPKWLHLGQYLTAPAFSSESWIMDQFVCFSYFLLLLSLFPVKNFLLPWATTKQNEISQLFKHALLFLKEKYNLYFKQSRKAKNKKYIFPQKNQVLKVHNNMGKYL